MRLSDEQKDIIQAGLLEKARLTENREYNRNAVKELNRAWKTEADWQTKRDFKERAQVGIRRIEAQTARIKALAMHRIAEEVGCDIYSVLYYEKSSGMAA